MRPQGETGYINQWMTIRNGEVGTKHVFAGTSRVVSKLVKQDKPNSKRKGRIVYEKDQYYYHPDHLGTTAYITHTNGQIYQHLEYFPFGETWVEEHSNKQRTPYLFTAKELDEETGLYYFGARYYDPRTSVWQNPDPILNKYIGSDPDALINKGAFNPSLLGLYAYVSNNPVIKVDPDGNAEYFTKSGQFIEASNPEDDNVYVRAQTENGGSANTSLDTSVSDFHAISATVYGEGPPRGRTVEESVGIANVIKNSGATRNQTMLESAHSGRFFGSDNAAAQDYLSRWTQAGRSEAPAARAGVISVLLGEDDPTGGRTMFEGIDLIDHPRSSFKDRYIDSGVAHDPVDIGDTRFFMERSPEEASQWEQRQSE